VLVRGGGTAAAAGAQHNRPARRDGPGHLRRRHRRGS